jgi:hypothetical protein
MYGEAGSNIGVGASAGWVIDPSTTPQTPFRIREAFSNIFQIFQLPPSRGSNRLGLLDMVLASNLVGFGATGSQQVLGKFSASVSWVVGFTVSQLVGQ